MQCPACGYMMSAFETDCPRCKAFAAKGMAAPLAGGRPLPNSPKPRPPSFDAAPPLPPDAPVFQSPPAPPAPVWKLAAGVALLAFVVLPGVVIGSVAHENATVSADVVTPSAASVVASPPPSTYPAPVYMAPLARKKVADSAVVPDAPAAPETVSANDAPPATVPAPQEDIADHPTSGPPATTDEQRNLVNSVAGSGENGTGDPGYHAVRAYTRRDGTYVGAHYQTNADHTRSDNWSERGNRNPFTGRRGSRR